MKVRIREAAAMMGIGYSTLRALIKKRRIGCESLGHRTKYVYLTEIEQYLKDHNKPRLN